MERLDNSGEHEKNERKKANNRIKIWTFIAAASGLYIGFDMGINHSIVETTDPKTGIKHRKFVENTSDSVVNIHPKSKLDFRF